MLGYIKRWLIHMLIRIFWIFPVDARKVVCVNYYGKGFGDNGKAVALSLLKKCPDIKIVWAAKKQFESSIPQGIRFVCYQSIRYYFDIATAGVWLDNSRKEREVIKRKGQYYVQLWHGGVPLKKIERDVEEQLGIGYVKEAKWDSKLADLMVSSCGFFTRICHSSFWYDGEVLTCGEPRVDELLRLKDDDIREKVRRELGIIQDQKVILYAPTFRNSGSNDCYKIEFERVISLLQSLTDEEWVFIVRLHPNIADKANFIPYSENIRNATNYPDLYELFSVVDILITDYSSLMFDGGLLKKPVHLFATDIEDYTKERGFYFDLKELPFTVSCSNEELLLNLSSFDLSEYIQKVDSFYKDIKYYLTGTAADTVADKILEVKRL